MNIKYYFASGNTAKGLINLLPSNLHGISQVIVLNGPSFTMKTYIINKIVQSLSDQYDLEVIYSRVGKAYLDGVIIREKSLAIISDTIALENLDNVKNVYLVSQETFHHEQKQEKESREKAYKCFETALSIHDELEKIYIREMDFSKADQIAEQLIDELLYDVTNRNKAPHVYRRLFGTTTTEGAINIVPELIGPLSRRIYLKGRAGTGKSFFMRKIAEAFLAKGFDLELYHCSFDPDSLDMVLVPSLGFCIFDSTAPHEFFPEREDDQVIDLYERAVNPGVDERFEKEISEVTERYRSYIQEGIKYLQEAVLWQEKIEQQAQWSQQADLDEIVNEILSL